MIEKLPLELFIAVLVTKYVRFQLNISDKMKVLRSDRCTSETGNACSIAVCVSEPFFFRPRQIFFALSPPDCDIRRFSKTGICVFRVATRGACSRSLTFCLLGGIRITFI